MGVIQSKPGSELALKNLCDVSLLRFSLRTTGVLLSVLIAFVAIQAQVNATKTDNEPQIVSGVTDAISYSMGRSMKVTGTVKNGAIALGGDVIVEGTVEGDVAAIGGSVIQLEGSRIGGDVIVVGGTYRSSDQSPNRGSARTLVYAGYENELRNMLRNPTEMVRPNWSATYIGFRILAILFWFIVSLALTALMPRTISEGITRLQLTNVRVAVIGFVGALVIFGGSILSLQYLPTPLSAVIGLLAFFLIVVTTLFGRVVLYAATGHWLQRKFIPFGKRSESVAILLGTSFWIALSSLPYVWPLVFSITVVVSLGLAFTARYRFGLKRSQSV